MLHALTNFGQDKLKNNSRNWTRNQPSNPFDEVQDQAADPIRLATQRYHRRIIREHKEHAPGPNSPRNHFADG